MESLATELAQLVAHALDRLLPRWCLACRRRLGSGPAPLLLCTFCRGSLRSLEMSAHCPLCLRRLAPAAQPAPCVGCRIAPPPFERLVAAWSYEPPLDRVVHALKFRRLDFLAAELAREAAPRIGWPACEPLDLVVAVPLPLGRRLRRGFNQAALVADAFARHLDLPRGEPLRRTSWWAPPQSRRASRAGRTTRPAPVAGRRGADLDGRRILLVDDVVTTGSTLRAAATALRAAGAARVVACALAATPLHHPPRPPDGLPCRPPGRRAGRLDRP